MTSTEHQLSVTRAGSWLKARTVLIAGCTVGVAVAVSGCGGGGHTASRSSGAGLAAEPAARILAAAEAAIDHVHSFHLQVTAAIPGTTVSESTYLLLPGEATLAEQNGSDMLDLRAVSGMIYFRGNRTYYASTGVRGAELATLPGRWVSATPSQVPTAGGLLALTQPATLGLCLLGQHLGTLSVGGTASVGGRRAVVLLDAGDRPGSAPGRIYVAATGPPLPLRITRTQPARPGGTSDAVCDEPASQLVSSSNEFISAVNAPLTINAPTDAVSLSSVTQAASGGTGIVAAAVQTAHTKLGTVGYRSFGSGPPLVLIMGYGGTMESWDPRFVDALAKHYRVVIFDNAGVADTEALPAPLTIDAMADQTSTLIDSLGLGKPDVLGWSMGGMIAQALAIRHPTQVHRLVLCATFPGTGNVVQPSQAAINALSSTNAKTVAADLFPANETAAAAAFGAAIAGYPSAAAPSAATISAQARAITQWWDDGDPAAARTAQIAVPTLVADGTDDRLDPVVNSHALAKLIPGAKLVLYPDAGHAFLFQDEKTLIPVVESFLFVEQRGVVAGRS
jgi:pimeloyl-ACP methyl ester carboxylesterase